MDVCIGVLGEERWEQEDSRLGKDKVKIEVASNYVFCYAGSCEMAVVPYTFACGYIEHHKTDGASFWLMLRRAYQAWAILSNMLSDPAFDALWKVYFMLRNVILTEN